MGKSDIERFAPLTGVVFVTLFLVGALTLPSNDYLPPVDDIVATYSGGANQAYVAIYLGLLGAFFLMWFAGSVHSAIRQHEAGASRLSAVALGGGLAAAIAIAFGFTVQAMGFGRAETAGGISPAEAATLYDMWSGIVGEVLPVSLAAFVGAGAIASLRNAVFPNWFGWVSVLVALACLSPVGYLAQIGAIVWVVVVSVWLTLRGGSQTMSAAAGEMAPA